MRKVLACLLLAALVACRGGTSGGGITWTNDTIARSNENDVVALFYPVAHGAPAADSVNAVIRNYLKSVFTDGELVQSPSLAGSIDSLLAAKNRDSFLMRRPYQLHCEGSVHLRGSLASVWLQTYAFTGGAHGLTLGRMFNFDLRNGHLLRRSELFTDTVRLGELNREAFRQHWQQRGLADMTESLFVRPDSLPLPGNIGFDSTGVVMLYNPYEIAPYYFGQSLYTLPYETVKPLLGKIVKK